MGSSLGAVTGAALSSMAKCVRWLHSHTVTETLESLSFLEQPLSDQPPMLKMKSSEELQMGHGKQKEYLDLFYH